MTVIHDRTYGNRGTLWSGMAYLYQGAYSTYEATHTVGGFTTGVHLLPTGSVGLVVGGWTYQPPPANPAAVDQSERFSTVKLVVFPPDGAPQERLRWDGTRIYDVSESRRMALSVASCSASNGDVAVLVRQVPIRQNAYLPWEYTLWLMTPPATVRRRRPSSRGGFTTHSDRWTPGVFVWPPMAPTSPSSRRAIRAFASPCCALLAPYPWTWISSARPRLRG